tara:strand:- start:53 stop:190 length:138 start_codon:yes stop_codon:yes gene_type:complete
MIVFTLEVIIKTDGYFKRENPIFVKESGDDCLVVNCRFRSIALEI